MIIMGMTQVGPQISQVFEVHDTISQGSHFYEYTTCRRLLRLTRESCVLETDSERMKSKITFLASGHNDLAENHAHVLRARV